MITNYNKFNIKESIYTEKDINKILDKGNFDESDLAVLNSYATDDKDIKEIIKKMREYQTSFEALNKQIKEEKDGIKKRQLFRKWLDMHEELSELENELRFKYKIEDPNKIRKLEESLNFNEKYEYDCILVSINNKEEASKAKKIIMDFCIKYELLCGTVNDIFDNLIESNSLRTPIYVRLITGNYNEVVLSWGKMVNFEDNQEISNYSYEKFFTINDLENGVLDNIKIYGKSNAKPNYRPRKIERTLESNQSMSDTYRKKLSYSKYSAIVVRIENQEDKDYFFNLVGWYGIFPDYNLDDYPIGTDYILTLKEGMSGIGAFRIAFANDYDYYDSGDIEKNHPNIYPKLLTSGDLYYVLKELLGVPDAKTMYKPKKTTRSLETMDEGTSYWPYRFKTREEFVQDYGTGWSSRIQYVNPDDGVGVSWARDMNYLLGQPCEIHGIDMTVNQRYHLPTDLIERGYWIITNEMLVKNRESKPSYEPRKISRTLESKENTEPDKYNFVIVQLENKEEFEKAQIGLFKQGYIWITDSHHIIRPSSNERFPFYIFVIGRHSYHKYKFFYENSNDLEDDSPELTILRREENSRKEEICPKIFNINDLKDINSLFNYRTPPTYTPRKINRALESIEWYPYRFKTEKEMIDSYGRDWKRLIDREVGWDSHMIYLLGQPFPQADFEMKGHTDDDWLLYNGEFGNWMVLPMMLTKNTPKSPSYNPKKITRTLEGTTWYPYRFKTENEMIDEFGENWRSDAFGTIGWSDIVEDGDGNFFSAMDRYLGKDFPYTKEQLSDPDFTENAISGRYDGWVIHWNMLTTNKPNKPSYEPKKTNRTLESLNESFRFFYNNKSLESESYLPKFKIGDIVTIKPSGLKIHLSRIEGHFVELDHNKDWIAAHIGKKMVVEDLAVNESGLWVINCRDENNSFNYVQQDALRKFAPTYEPRKMDRTIE